MSMSKGFNESGIVLGLCLAIFVSWLTIYGLLLVRECFGTCCHTLSDTTSFALILTLTL